MSVIQQVDCPQCHMALKPAKPLPAGTLVKCPRCGLQFITPGPAPPAAAMSPPLPAKAAAAPLPPVAAVAPPLPAKAVVAPTPAPVQVKKVPFASFVEAPPESTAPDGPNRTVGWGIVVVGGAGLLASAACLLLALFFVDDRPGKETKLVDAKDGQIVQEIPKTLDIKPPPPPPPPSKVFPPGPPDERVTKAIDRGIAFFKKTQSADGSWSEQGGQTGLQLGVTAFAGLTLVSCDVKTDDPAVQRAASYVREHCLKVDGDKRELYQLSLAMLFLDKLNDPSDRDRIQNLALRIVAAQLPSGGWSYTLPQLSGQEQQQLLRILLELKTKSPGEVLRQVAGKTALPPPLQNLAVLQTNGNAGAEFFRRGGDNSNTQFAVLALLAAKRYDLPLDNTLALVAQRFRMTQGGTGGWTYSGTEAESFSMTCAGLLGYSVGFGVSKDFSRVRPVDDPQVKKALGYLGQSIGGPPLDGYALWSLERVAVLYQLNRINGKDWYSWGKDIILGRQIADGSIEAHIPTCFGLLFLRRVNLVEDLTETIRSRGAPE